MLKSVFILVCTEVYLWVPIVLFDCFPQWLCTANQTSNPYKLNRLRIPPDSRLINYWLFTSAAKELNQKLPGTRRWSEQALKLISPDFNSDTIHSAKLPSSISILISLFLLCFHHLPALFRLE